MQPKAFEEKLRARVSECKSRLSRMTELAEEKMKQEVDGLNLDVDVTVDDIRESMQRTLREAEAEIDSLDEVTLGAWKTRGEEIRTRIEDRVDELTDRFESLAESLKEQ